MSTSSEAGSQLLPVYDVVIVGAGMMGSSAARHVTRMTQDGRRLTVCLIGPEEPQSRDSCTIFGAHYDAGRIVGTFEPLFPESMSASLARKSIARYRQLENETGIRFYYEVGTLLIDNENSIESAVRCSETRGLQHLTGVQLTAMFPYLGRQDSDQKSSIFAAAAAVLETANAGYINPRQFCIAQQTAAQHGGCHVIRDIVRDVIAQQPEVDGVMRVTTDGGLTIHGRKVLVAVGAFTGFRQLLPPGVQLELTQVTQSVIFAELSQADRDRLRNMPSMAIEPATVVDNIKRNTEDQLECYILPPITYPNGKTYLKLGHGTQYDVLLSSPEDIVQWYRNPVPDRIRLGLSNMLCTVFPDISPVSVHYDTCVTTNTPTHRPYIDLLTPSFGVALGGNEYGATCSEEIGRMAADLLVTGSWSHDLPRDAFRAVRTMT